jgi:PIN domain nuclease of toxin-antitoxin system
MSKVTSVLDSSAILAVLNAENGAENVEPLLSSSIVSSINVAEVLTKLVERNIRLKDALEDFLKLGLEIIEFDIKQAAKVAELRPVIKHLGLSLGDRSCLALAISENITAVTADKIWSNLNLCKVKVIR